MDLRAARVLFGLKRGDVLEILVNGVCGVMQDGAIVTPELSEMTILSRSTLKPWQFLALDLFEDDDLWILGMASTAGQEIQVEELRRFRDKLGGDENKLVLPKVLPSNPHQRARCQVEGRSKSPFYHFCCGKHLMMQFACRKFDYPLEGYWLADHPLQRKIKGFVENQLGQKAYWETDGCALPTLSTTIGPMLRLWHGMGVSTDSRVCLMKDMWARNPLLIGGDDCLDTEIIRASDGRVIAKEGADGLIVLQTRSELGEKPFTMLMKLSHGFSKYHMILSIWSQLNLRKRSLSGAMVGLLNHFESRKNQMMDPRHEFISSDKLEA